MMRALAFLDLGVVIVLLAQPFLPISWRIALIAAAYLLIKSWLFWPDFVSVLDGIVGLIILFGIAFTYLPASLLAAFHIAQKAIMTLL